MRLVVPFVTLNPLTEQWIDEHAPHAERIYVGSDDESYYRLLCDLWAAGQDFMLVEHDMLPHANSESQFTSCPNHWCVAPYEGKQPIWTGRSARAPRGAVVFRCALGCTRFRRELLAELPEAVTHMRLHRWDRLDSQLASYLFQHGQKACEHSPHVTHLHDYDAEVVMGR